MKQQAFRIAEHQTVERILNAYVRESGSRLTFSAEDYYTDDRANWMILELPKQKCKLLGTITYFSEFGHHHYGEKFWLIQPDQSIEPVDSAIRLAEMIVEEIDTDPESGNKEELLSNIQNSMEKTALYLEKALHQPQKDGWGLDREERLRWMEQRLLLGHPFHPTPKSSEGFTNEDLQKYAPELQAAFPLHFFAIHPDWIEEDWTSDIALSNDQLFPSEVCRQLKDFISEGYRLFPMHPWQAEYVLKYDVWQKGVKQGKIVNLNRLGPDVFPTSSVRTVWSPHFPYTVKLPLHVRITHFVRENTPEQVERSIDASRVITHLRKTWTYPSLTVLAEVGSLQFRPPKSVHANGYPLAASNVLLRENPDLSGGRVPLVVASLLERWPNQSEPPVFAAIRQAAGVPAGKIPDLKLAEWLNKYLEITLIPVLELFADEGVSLEAHVQNSMMHLENGWPDHFYVRDLEGVSISKDTARTKGYVGSLLTPDSPVLYTEEKAWERLQYYFIVNHLGHLIYVLSYYGKWSEKEAWGVVRRLLEKQQPSASPRMRTYIDRLLQTPTLRAKANLISRFQNRADSAIYVDLPNPIISSEVKVK
ncbi:IucA/IucC family protein [Lihuaxuella thermophila]|uniref:Siderophore synthetase component n=1 Tax=Lihuaxuella thermophila TaxID=1173111 RepID=A0A1H8DDY9_9BACL|nr:IucA/IucC family protein [Lihuaxuella thermophila]SEN05376.1 Siderophore synthetase component [Lihuaxuella thermophila]